jgi:hypothetical protein
MDARDFFVIAERFKASESEAERRTSIGRSYYALFNVLLGKLSDKGVMFAEGPDDHYKLISYLVKAGNKTAGLVGAALKDLRLDRNQADYEMKIVIDARKSDLLYQKATKAMAQFDSIPALELQKIVEQIQALR